MNKKLFTLLIYLMLITIALILPSLSFGILMTILVAYILIPKKVRPKWLNIQLLGIILSFIYIYLSQKSPSHFGFTAGSWNEHLLKFIFISIIVLSVPRIIDYKSKGKLVFQPMNVRGVFFWLFVVGFGEEILFRGIIQSEFGFWAATITFGLFHAFNIVAMTSEKSLTSKHLLVAFNMALMSGAIGAVFGYLYYLTESLFAVALLHGLFDMCNNLFPPEKELKENKLY